MKAGTAGQPASRGINRRHREGKSLPSINQEGLRNHNLSVVLQTLLSSENPLSRADLADITGLTKATISMQTAILQKNRLLEDLQTPVRRVSSDKISSDKISSGKISSGEASSGKISRGKISPVKKMGRPSVPLGFAPASWAGLGAQINTDGYGFLLLDFTGQVLAQEWESHPMVNIDPQTACRKVETLIQPTLSRFKRRHCRIVPGGLALPGLVADGHHLLMARNLGWEQVDLNNYPLVSQLRLYGANEANLAAIAQVPGYATHMEAETYQNPNSFIYISTDIGIGGAYVRQGQISRGNHEFAGELGHVSVNFKGPVCLCGRRGCVEMYAGRRALVEAAGIAQGQAAVQPQALDELLDRWHQGDPQARKAMRLAIRALNSVIASAMNVVDVDTAMVGGFWSRIDDSVMEEMTVDVADQVLGSSGMSVTVMKPPVNDHPALRGAAELGLRRVIDNPLQYLD